MAYTNAWNDGLPTGFEASDTIDDIVRGKTLDIRERINSLLGVSISTPLADPIVAASSSLATLRAEATVVKPLGELQTFSIFLPHAAALWTSTYADLVDAFHGAGTYPMSQEVLRGTGDATIYPGVDAKVLLTGHMPIVLPVGAVVTAMSAIWDSSTNSTIAHYFKEVTATGVVNARASSAGAMHTTGYGAKTIVFSAPYTILTDAYYFVQIGPWSNITNKFCGLKVTYTSANANVRI